jgi:carbon storage regulator
MLVLGRKIGEEIRISDDIVIVIKEIKHGRAGIGIRAPKAVRVMRGELQDRPQLQIQSPDAPCG